MSTVRAPNRVDTLTHQHRSGSCTTVGYRGVLSAVSLAAATAAVGLYIAYVVRFGVNVPHWDDWSIVPLLQASKAGTLHFSQLWSQHNEHRMLIPNVIALAVGHLFHFNVKFEMYIGASCLAAFVVGVIATMRSLTRRNWIDYAPVATVMFMPVQWQNSLWGFQFALFLILSLFGACLYILCRFRSIWGLVLAVGMATAASFSSLQGLFVWPAAGLLLWAGKRSRTSKVVWILTSALVWFLYFWHFRLDESGAGGLSFALHHPIEDLKFFFTALGGFALGWGGLGAAQLFGLGMFLLASVVLVLYARSDRELIEAVPAALVAYALLFDLALVAGRGGFGTSPALESRYVTYNLPILVGVYLALIEHRHWRGLTSRAGLRRFLIAGAGASTLVLVCVSATRAVSVGRKEATNRRASESVLVNYRVSSDPLLLQFLTFPAPANALEVRDSVPFLEQQHDSVFANPALVASLRADGRPGSTRQLLPSGYLMPVSAAIGAATSSSLSLQDAWAVLSTVYYTRSALQRAFPVTAPNFDREILGWAVSYGTNTDYDVFYLGPELPSLKKLDRIALRP